MSCLVQNDLVALRGEPQSLAVAYVQLIDSESIMYVLVKKLISGVEAPFSHAIGNFNARID